MQKFDMSKYQIHPHVDVCLPEQNRPQIECSSLGREACGCYLIEQRLKLLIVVLAQQGDANVIDRSERFSTI